MKDTVFQQLLKPITKKLINECVQKFNSDYDCESFDTRTHLITMIYAQIHQLNSLRTLEAGINGQKIGLKCKISRSTVSDANRRRNANCFYWLLEKLLSYFPKKKSRLIRKIIKVLDSTPIILKGRGFDEWAKAYANDQWQGIKLHAEYDLGLSSVTRVLTSHANINDCSIGQRWPIYRDIIYIFDRGYVDFNWWWEIHQKKAFFVTRFRKKTSIVIESQKEALSKTILADETFKFKNKTPRGGKKNLYSESLRRVHVFREGKNPLILVTNLHDLPAETIARLYKDRWAIELFFKWIKQNLRIKKFLGRSESAVKIQLATALIAYVLIQLYKILNKDERKLYLILIWIRCNPNINFRNRNRRLALSTNNRRTSVRRL